MKNKIIENGCCEVSGVDSYKYEFSKAIELTTFVQIVKMSSYVHPNDSMQITCDCDALDGFGKNSNWNGFSNSNRVKWMIEIRFFLI